jgi:hypothetical protein
MQRVGLNLAGLGSKKTLTDLVKKKRGCGNTPGSKTPGRTSSILSNTNSKKKCIKEASIERDDCKENQYTQKRADTSP